MEFYRLLLLVLIGAISALVWMAVYVGSLFLRYPSPPPILSPEMWGWVLGVPAGIGALTGLVFPLWQRRVTIEHPFVRHVLLWMIVALILAGVQCAILGSVDALRSVFSIDFLFWMGSAVIGGICFYGMRVLTRETDVAKADVMGKLRHSIRFRPDSTHETTALSLVFDLQGFAAFFNQPLARDYVADYLDHVFRAVSIWLFGGRPFWGVDVRIGSLMRPSHQKFLGDGGLYIWTPPAGKKSFSPAFTSELVTRLSRFSTQLPEINKAAASSVPRSFQLPGAIRWGLAQGKIHELTRRHSRDREYLGFCINLASRLQAYCPDLSLKISSRVKVPQAVLDREGLIKVTATQIKGFREEEVIVDRSEFARLSEETRQQLFAQGEAPE